MVAGVLALTVDWGVAVRAAATVGRDPLPLVAALAAYTLAFVLRAAAWNEVLPVALPLSRRLRALFGMIAVNHALPGPVGEVARARLVSAPGDFAFRTALASVVAARAVDVFALAVLAMAAAAWAGGSPWWLAVASPSAILAGVAAFGLARRRGASLRVGRAVRCVAWAIPSWALEAGVVLAVAHAAGVEVGVAGAVLATCAGVLSHVVAVLPGGVGTYEAGVASALAVVGVPAADALAVATTTHAVKFAYSFAVGLPALGWRRPGRALEASDPVRAVRGEPRTASPAAAG